MTGTQLLTEPAIEVLPGGPHLRTVEDGIGRASIPRHCFVGRDDELRFLADAYAAARSGRGGLILLGGDAGIGKSRLAAELAVRARDDGARVLAGRCWEFGTAPACWPWLQVVRSYERGLDRDATTARPGPDLAALRSVLGGARPPGSLLDGGPGEAEGAPFELFDAMTTLLANAGRSRPLVVILEDMHEADTSSLLLLRYVTDALGEMPVLIVAIHRDRASGASSSHFPTVLADLAQNPVTRRLRLDGLDDRAVARLIEAATGVPASEPSVRLVRSRTGGNPLFVEEMVHALAAERPLGRDLLAAGWRRTIPGGVQAVIGSRLALLSPDCHLALAVASVVGRDFRIDVLSCLVGGSSDQLLTTLEEAASLGILEDAPGAPGTLRFTEPIVREAFYGDLPPTRRMRLHRETGELLETIGAHDSARQLGELAFHFRSAGLAGCARKSIRYTLLAGELAVDRAAYDEADALLRLALDELDSADVDDHGTRGRITLALAAVEAGRGNLAGARRVFLRTADLARRHGLVDLLALAALGYGTGTPWSEGHGDDAFVLLLEQALTALGDADGPLRARVMATLAATRGGDAPSREVSASLSREAVAMARRVGCPGTLADVLDAAYAVRSGPDDLDDRLDIATDLIRAASESGDRSRLLRGHRYRSVSRLERGDVAGAVADIGAQSQLEPATTEERRSVATLRATIATLRGDLPAAERLVPTTETAAGDRALQLYLLYRLQGRTTEAEDLLSSAVGRCPGRRVLRAALAQVQLELGRDRPAPAALDELAGCARRAPGEEWMLEVALASEVVARSGDGPWAAALYDLLAPYAARNAVTALGSTGSLSRNLGLLAATCGRWPDAVRHFDTALVANQRLAALPWIALTVADRSRALREVGSSRPAPVIAEATPEPLTVFRCDGEFWSVVFGLDAFRLRDSKGLGYLAQLLARPGEELHPLAMAGTCVLDPSRSGIPAARSDGLSASGLEAVGEMIDATARAAYQRRLADLRDDLADAESRGDGERAAVAQDEIDFLAHELAAAFGLGGRPRRMGSPAERARQSVTKAIRAALERVAGQSPDLGRHLNSTIRTGTFCSYNPDPRLPTSWQL